MTIQIWLTDQINHSSESPVRLVNSVEDYFSVESDHSQDSYTREINNEYFHH